MASRVVACFLAVLLLWSGLNTIEAPRAFAQSSPGQQHAIGDAGGRAAAHEGSVEHHHLDDLPSQVQSDPPTDTPALLPFPPRPGASLPTGSLPRSLRSAAAESPVLAGPLRPPCSGSATG